MRSLTIIPYVPQRALSSSRRKSERDSVRHTLLDNITADFGEFLSDVRSYFHVLIIRVVQLTGNPDARVRWAAEEYALYVVIRYGLKIVGWPDDVPFANLNRVGGGVATLRRLQRLWDEKSLRFAEATDKDVENAKRDPTSVLPGVSPRPRSPSPPASPAAASPSAMVQVIHPYDMNPLYTFPANGPLNKCPRDQRVDLKRKRKGSGEDDGEGPSSRRRRGVLSARHVLEPDDAGCSDESGAVDFRRTLLVDDRIEAFTPVTTGLSGLGL